MGHELKTIKNLCTFSNGHGFTRNDWGKAGLPIIRISHLNGSRKFDYFGGEPDPDWVVEPGDLLFAWAGTRGVSFGPTIWRGPRGVLNQHIFRVRTNRGVDKEWLYYVLLQITQRVERRAHGFKATLLHVRKSDIENQAWRVPVNSVQRKIAAVLGLADDELRALEALIQSKRQLMRGYEQQLLSGHKRFRAFRRSAWHQSRLGDHVQEVTRRNAAGIAIVLTASGEYGLVDQRRYFNRSVAGADLSKYYLLRKGEFAYNRSAMNGFPYGATKRLDEHEEGALSTLYLCFSVVDSNLDSDYLKHVFDSGILDRQLRPIVRVGARAHGLLNVSSDEFFSVSIPFPKLQEQKRIAEVLNAFEREIELLAALRDKVELRKRGLISNLLSAGIAVARAA